MEIPGSITVPYKKKKENNKKRRHHKKQKRWLAWHAWVGGDIV